MKLKITYLAILFTFILVQGFSQTNSNPKILRKEIELERRSDEFFVVPAGKEGIIVFNETDVKTVKGERAWAFKKLNTNLEEVWVKNSSISKNLNYERFYQDGNYIYILLVESYYESGEITRAFRGHFTVVKIEPVSGQISSAAGDVPFNTSVSDFKVVNDVAFFGGETVPTRSDICLKTCYLYFTCMIPVCFGGAEFKRDATLVSLDMKKGTTKISSQNFKGSSFTTGLAVDTTTKTILSIVGNKYDKKNTKTYIKEYASNGDLKRTIEVDPNGNNELIDASISKISESEKLLLGTYSSPLEKQSFLVKMGRAMAPTSNPFAEGVYISKYTNDKQNFIKYYSFNDFKNFYNYLGTTNEQKIEKKIKQKKAKGKDLDINYTLLVHDIVKSDGQYIFVGEAYYKEYHTEVYYDAQGRARTRRVFDGYRYTHAVVAGLDENGKLLWDSSFPIWNILTMELKERVKTIVKNDKVILVYNYSGALTSKIISENKLTDYHSIPIETNYDGDMVKSNSQSDMFYWYDDYFLAFGYQKIKNKNTDLDKDGDKDIKKKRNVLYLNKIIFK